MPGERRRSRGRAVLAAALLLLMAGGCAEPVDRPAPPAGPASDHPWHTGIVATTFWVGEVFDPDAEDGTQVRSAWDLHWMRSYGGCDGVLRDGRCRTEARRRADGWFPSSMTPLENPFYVDVPFDDVNDDGAFARRGEVVPWADEPGYADAVEDRGVSLLKNRWIMLHRDGRVCYAQIEDAGPGEYDDAGYVFGRDDARPANRRYNGAGMDVSPAVNGCLGFSELDGQDDLIDWRFVEAHEVPEGPWTRVVTTSGVNL